MALDRIMLTSLFDLGIASAGVLNQRSVQVTKEPPWVGRLLVLLLIFFLVLLLLSDFCQRLPNR
jgi:hypothetical protein